jgi:hypothetical protein
VDKLVLSKHKQTISISTILTNFDTLKDKPAQPITLEHQQPKQDSKELS